MVLRHTFLATYLRAEGEEGDRGWDGWRASLMQWTWTWANSGRPWGTGRPDMLQSMGSQRVGHNWATEQQQHGWADETWERDGRGGKAPWVTGPLHRDLGVSVHGLNPKGLPSLSPEIQDYECILLLKKILSDLSSESEKPCLIINLVCVRLCVSIKTAS